MRPVSMVGLSVLLEDEQRSSSSSNNSNAGFIKQAMVNKAAAKVVRIGHFSRSSSYVITPCLSSPRQLLSRPLVFLDVCFLCKNNLLPGKDIYMYKGDRGFCSVECRFRQILLDEQAAAAGSSDHSSSSPASLSAAVKL